MTATPLQETHFEKHRVNLKFGNSKFRELLLTSQANDSSHHTILKEVSDPCGSINFSSLDGQCWTSNTANCIHMLSLVKLPKMFELSTIAGRQLASEHKELDLETQRYQD